MAKRRSKSNKWHSYLKKHSGKGHSIKQLAKMYKQGKAPSRRNPRLPPRTPTPTWGEAGIVYLAIAVFVGVQIGKRRLS